MFKLQTKSREALRFSELHSDQSRSYTEGNRRPSFRKLAKEVLTGKRPPKSLRPSSPDGWNHEDEVVSRLNLNQFVVDKTSKQKGAREHEKRYHKGMSSNRRRDSKLEPLQILSSTSVDVRITSKGPSSESIHSYSTYSTIFSIGGEEKSNSNRETTESTHSTRPRDQPLNTPYATKRVGLDFSSTRDNTQSSRSQKANVAQRCKDIDFRCFPVPPSDFYNASQSLSSKGSISTFIPPTPTLSPPPTCPLPPIPVKKKRVPRIEKPTQNVSPFNISAEQQRSPSLYVTNNHTPQQEEPELTDYEIFLAQSRSQAYSARYRHDYVRRQLAFPQTSCETPQASKVLDNFTTAHNMHRNRLESNTSTTHTKSATQPLRILPPKQMTSTVTENPAYPGNQCQSRFSTDSHLVTSRAATATGVNSTASSLYGKVREYIFPPQSAESSIKGVKINGQMIMPLSSDHPRLFPVDVRNAALHSGSGAGELCDPRHAMGSNGHERGVIEGPASEQAREGRSKTWRWSRVSRAVKRSLSLDRDKEIERCTFDSDTSGMYRARTHEEQASWKWEGEWRVARQRQNFGASRELNQLKADRRRSLRVMPTSAGLERYNRGIDNCVRYAG